MAELYSQQQTLLRIIERSLEHFKKIGKNNYTPAKIRSRIAALKDVRAQCIKGHASLLQVYPKADRESLEYFTQNHFELADDLYLNTLDYMTECLEEIEQPTPVSDAESSKFQQMSTASSFFSLAHLPTINIPPFSGNCENWENFRDQFTALIIKNPDLSDFARMHFLSASLTGRALDSIKNLKITADNFSIAWKTLTARYEKKRRLIEVHVASLYDLPQVARESAEALNNLRDKANNALASLKNLGRSDEEILSDMLVFTLSRHLDSPTRKAWKLKYGDDDNVPTFRDLDKFLEARANSLEEFAAPIAVKSPRSTKHSNVTAAAASASSCELCKSAHFINKCSLFLAKNPSQRAEIIKRSKRCFNCLSTKHAAQSCPSKYSCRTCHKKHHSLLHVDSTSSMPSQVSTPSSSPGDSSENPPVASLSSIPARMSRSQILLATARVRVLAPSGRTIVVRALLDQGSEITFISERMVQLLRLRRIRRPVTISGIGCVDAGTCKHATNLKITPFGKSTPILATTAAILPSLTNYAPPSVQSSASWEHLAGLELADPDFTNSDSVDLILGADLYCDILLDGIRKGPSGQPFAQNTVFGWVLSGPASSQTNLCRQITVQHCSREFNLDQELRKFWEVEEVPRTLSLSPDEQRCEDHFVSTHSRAPDGRYIVRLPFKTAPPLDIGESRGIAKRFLNGLHRRLASHANLKTEYVKFLQEYEQLEHMRRANISELDDSQNVYIPHHPVIRDSSVTTRLRVVFNASSATTNSTSLNDHLLAGPKLQTDLAAVILRWRLPRYVFSADIAKMYRQILVDPRDINYQRILWSSSEKEPPQDFQLLTVTYGTASAPFLALRVLRQLLHDEGQAFPLAVPVLQENIYVDDVLFGADDIPLIRQTRDQVCALLKRGRFELRKWASNSALLLSDIELHNHGLACSKTLQTDEQLKVLGISWIPGRDVFQFNVSIPTQVPNTKRAILSMIAKFFDPLGWGTPVTVAAKIFLQKLWQSRLDWDEPLSEPFQTQWELIYSSLTKIDGLQIDRWTKRGSDTARCELHGFSDASVAAYAAAVYLRVVSLSGEVVTSLLVGKSKVAPVKTMSIPRLELSAAVLLSRLLEFTRSSLNLSHAPCWCWTDSTIVLAWLNQHPGRWKTFVANRVSDIQSRLPGVVWRHVPTQDNPADCASRGVLGDHLVDHALWWRGPRWLCLDTSEWPVLNAPPDTAIEEKTRVSALVSRPRESWDLAERYSSWTRLLRITAYIMRFVSRVRRNAVKFPQAEASSPALTPHEFQQARQFWVRAMQADLFPRELEALSHKKPISPKSALLSLNPFLDEDKIIRVGGRLENAPLPFKSKHPIVLASHKLVNLIVTSIHLRSLHSGTQLTLATLRQEYWVLRARTIVKAVTYRCVACTRERAATPSQLMGSLPLVRVSPPSRAFLHCGVDYAGPVLIRALSGRGLASHKAYIAIFICMATRAIHLEIVDGYSTAAFLAAYARFCARREFPESMYSDNGTTFTGAERELKKAFQDALKDPDFQNRTVEDRVSWHFIPPSAPHFGGLWEAGVRSVKHHLRRVLGSHTLTYEEFATLLCNVEACLNSRPLAPLRDSLEEYEPLTPGHFLIGSAITAIPEPSVLQLRENRLSRWQAVRQLSERFWKLWTQDYVNTLQQRVKWRKLAPTLIRPGQLVLLQNPLLPPCKWDLGRVTQCHPGNDGLIRVVTIKTAQAEYKRPITKICLLPIDIETVDLSP